METGPEAGGVCLDRGARMRIHVEFYGVARARAGIAETVVELPPNTATLGAVLRSLSQRLPSLSRECIEGDHLRSGFIANIGGQRFTRDPHAVLQDNQCVLLMSADAGG